MKKTLTILIITLLLGIKSFAQDLVHFANGEQFPIYLSKTKILIQYRDKSLLEKSKLSDIAPKASRLNIIEQMNGLAVLSYEESTSKSDFDQSISSLRKNTNILTAHPFMVSKEGEIIGAFLDDLIVRVKSGKFEDFQAILKSNNLTVKDRDPFDDQLYYVTGEAVLGDPIGVCNKLYLTGNLEFAQPNNFRIVIPTGTPNDQYIANQGHIKAKFPDAWDITTGCSTIKIAIIDNGVQLNHPDLVGNLLPGFDATPSGTSGGPVAGEQSHGTNCAGFAAATGNNSIGVAGGAYTSKIVPIRAYYTNAGGDIIGGGGGTKDQYLVSAINFAKSNADVISMSFVLGTATDITIDQAIDNALTTAATSGRGNKGCVLLAATGNKNVTSAPYLPVRNAKTLAIGASNANDQRWNANSSNGSNYPSGLVDVVAPGFDVTTSVGSNYDNSIANNDIRTSWATPMAAGLAALILSVDPNLTELQVRTRIVETADKVGGYTYSTGGNTKFPTQTYHQEVGMGRINALRAVEKTAGGPVVGPDLVCTTGSFSITSLPNGATFGGWSTSDPSRLTINSAGTATRVGSGEVTVSATISFPGACSSVKIHKKIYVGDPIPALGYYVNNGLQYGLIEDDESYPNTFCFNTNPTFGNVFTTVRGASSISWTKISSTPASLPWTQPSTGNLSITFQGPNQQGMFRYNYSNACASLSKFYGFKSVSCAGLLAYPNPATSTMTIEFENTEELEYLPERVILISEATKQTVVSLNIGDYFSQKKFRDNNKIDMNVGELPRGVYYIHSVPAKDSKLEVQKIRVVLE